MYSKDNLHQNTAHRYTDSQNNRANNEVKAGVSARNYQNYLSNKRPIKAEMSLR